MALNHQPRIDVHCSKLCGPQKSPYKGDCVCQHHVGYAFVSGSSWMSTSRLLEFVNNCRVPAMFPAKVQPCNSFPILP